MLVGGIVLARAERLSADVSVRYRDRALECVLHQFGRRRPNAIVAVRLVDGIVAGAVVGRGHKARVLRGHVLGGGGSVVVVASAAVTSVGGCARHLRWLFGVHVVVVVDLFFESNGLCRNFTNVFEENKKSKKIKFVCVCVRTNNKKKFLPFRIFQKNVCAYKDR